MVGSCNASRALGREGGARARWQGQGDRLNGIFMSTRKKTRPRSSSTARPNQTRVVVSVSTITSMLNMGTDIDRDVQQCLVLCFHHVFQELFVRYMPALTSIRQRQRLNRMSKQ